MNFASFPFLLFLSVCTLIYFSLKKSGRHWFLLFASYFFYALFGFGFALLMLITSAITYTTSYYCSRSEDPRRRRFLLWLGLGLDLSIFVLFKYIHIIDMDIMNWPDWSAQKLLIPVGISFYTFKTIGYCVDIYRRKYAAEPSFAYYALSVSFFPQLIAGPIEKSVVIAAQLKKGEGPNKENIMEGAKLIVWGLFKKVVIADSIAQTINVCYTRVEQYSGLDFLVISVAFIYQIYADFSGYSDIAIGAAKFFNVHLPSNFNKPFFAKNYRDFWTRWHTTFSRWLKEYVFDELGGVVRHNRFKTVRNLFIVFLVVGFWHGATPNYMIYAMLAFVWMLLDIVTKDQRKDLFAALKIKKGTLLMRSINYMGMIIMFTSLAFFFRPVTTQDSMIILSQLSFTGLHRFNLDSSVYILLMIIVLEVLQSFQLTPDGSCFQGIKKTWIRMALYIIILFLLIGSSARPDVSFQYFQF